MVALQKHLGFKVEFHQPVMDLHAAAAILRCHEDEIREMVYVEFRLPAWNIARVPSDPSSGGSKDNPRKRHNLRLFGPAIRDLANARLNEEYDDDLIQLRVYGRPRLLLKSTYLARCWYCDPEHIGDLIRDQTFTSVQPLAQGIVADVTWPSALAFLNARRIK
jgi:hypothetical protein